jgi:hypothetical protein
MATTTLSFSTPAVSDPFACQKKCQGYSFCKFFQWNHSKNECQLLNSDIKQIYKEAESLLGVPDCNSYVSLWKKQLIAPPTPTPPPATTTTTTTTTKRTGTSLITRVFSSSEASLGPETGEILPLQNSTSVRYTCHNRKGLKGEANVYAIINCKFF